MLAKLFVIGSLTLATTAGRANTVEAPAGVIIRLAKPSDGDWGVRAPSGEQVCQLPCEVSVDDSEGWSVERLEPDGYRSESYSLPETARLRLGTILDTRVRHKAGRVLGAAIVTGFGVTALATGLVIIAAGGCAGGDGASHPFLCFTSIGLLPLGLVTGLAGGVWLLLSHSGRVEVVSENTPRASPPVKVGFSGSAAGVTLRF
jgi:hypothetical protein